jgi:hypothetical protein
MGHCSLPFRTDIPGALDAAHKECCIAVLGACVLGAHMNDIVEKVLISYGTDVNGAREKLRNYLDLLASAGKTDEQLLAFGIAYVQEILEPNPRYSGC